MVKPSQYWKEKYDALCGAIQEIHETVNVFKTGPKGLPDECDSTSDEFFVSNVLEIVDNEEYAKKHWGKGKYFRVVRADAPQAG